MRSLFVLYMFLCCWMCLAQTDLANYQPVQCKGAIPVDFTGLFSERYLDDLKKAGIPATDKKFSSDNQVNFYLKSNFFLSQMFQNGNILYNDLMSDYVSDVLDILLKDNKEVRSALRVYTLKSTEVNSWATHNGIILVSTAMLAHLSNEAELAYLLSHEIVHYLNHHNINLYLEEKRISVNDKNDNNVENDDSEVRFGEKNTLYLYYSRELESEADEEGLTNYFSKTAYNLDAVDGLMNVLQTSQLPFEEMPFDKSVFESKWYKIPASYTLAKLNEIKKHDQDNDTLSTHPNLKKRREKLHELLKNYSNQGRKSFLLSPERFNEIKTVARFETLRQYLINHDFVCAFYNASILLQAHPGNTYLETIMASAIYGIAKYRNGNALRSPFRVEGEIHQLYYLFEKLNKGEINVLCVRYLWVMHRKYLQNEYLRTICYDLTSELFRYSYYNAVDFLKNIPDSTSLIDSSRINVFQPTVKQGTMKSAIRIEDYNSSATDYTRYAFVDLFSDTAFSSRFYDASLYYENRKKKIQAQKQARESSKYNISIKSEQNFQHGLDSVITICPVFFYSKSDDDIWKNYHETEKRMLFFLDAVERKSLEAGVKSNLLSIYKVDGKDYEKYNEYSIIMDWLREANDTPHDITVINSEDLYLYPICSKYNTRYLDLTGMFSFRRSFELDYTCYYYNVLMEIEAGKIVLKDYHRFGNFKNIEGVEAYIYDSFERIKNKK